LLHAVYAAACHRQHWLDCSIGAILAIDLGFALIFERCPELQSRSRFTD
jgi:hypothetical protein